MTRRCIEGARRFRDGFDPRDGWATASQRVAARREAGAGGPRPGHAEQRMQGGTALAAGCDGGRRGLADSPALKIRADSELVVDRQQQE
ncbi:putative exported protein [Paraburkholderia tropica]|nr:putative exported protein [Paraburkholderia tropica]